MYSLAIWTVGIQYVFNIHVEAYQAAHFINCSLLHIKYLSRASKTEVLL
jgi:hypothetical protein